MKSRKILIPFCAGVVLGATLFGGAAAYAAAGVMAERSEQAVYVDGRRVELEAYLINDANYVKLRDVGQATNAINVYWDGSAVQIQSGVPYTGEAPAGATAPQEPAAPAAAPDESAKANPAIFTGSYTREAYNALRQAIGTGMGSTPIAMPADTRDAMQEVIAAIGNWPAYHLESAGGKQYFIEKYSDSYQEAAEYCRPFIDSLAGKSDTDKVRAIAYFVCDRLTYETNAFTSPRTVLISDAVSKGNCMSYAHNFMFLCNMADIPCVFVHSADHQWNQVYVDGQWWHVDVSSIDVGDDTASRVYSRIIYDDDYVQGASYQQTQPMLTMFAKEVLIPGSTR